DRYTATVLGTDPTADVALLRLTRASSFTPIDVGDSSKVGVGDAVVALGNAGGVGGTPAVATGYVTALEQSITASDSSGANPQRHPRHDRRTALRPVGRRWRNGRERDRRLTGCCRRDPRGRHHHRRRWSAGDHLRVARHPGEGARRGGADHRDLEGVGRLAAL